MFDSDRPSQYIFLIKEMTNSYHSLSSISFSLLRLVFKNIFSHFTSFFIPIDWDRITYNFKSKREKSFILTMRDNFPGTFKIEEFEKNPNIIT